MSDQEPQWCDWFILPRFACVEKNNPNPNPKIVSLPIERISLNAFGMEEAEMPNKYGKNSSFSKLFEKRITNLAKRRIKYGSFEVSIRLNLSDHDTYNLQFTHS